MSEGKRGKGSRGGIKEQKPDKKTTQENTTRKPNKQDLRKEDILKFCIEPKSLFDIIARKPQSQKKRDERLYQSNACRRGAEDDGAGQPDKP